MTKYLKRLVVAILPTLLLAGCGNSATIDEESDITAADERGRADAMALSRAGFTTDRDLHAALLSVKSREWKMRNHGDSIGAAAYIRAFRQCLTEIDPELSTKVF